MLLTRTGPGAFRVVSIVIFAFTAISKCSLFSWDGMFKLLFYSIYIYIALGLLHLSITSSNYTLLMLATCANGFICLAEFSIVFEMVVAIVPELGIGEATVCGFINVLANLFGFLLILGLTPLLNNGE